MLKKSLIASLGLSVLLSGYAQAENYFGGNFSYLDYSEEGFSEDASPTAIIGRLGTEFNPYFSGELRMGVGVSEGTLGAADVEADLELDNMYGAYVRGGMPVTELFFPYALIGYSRGELTAIIPGIGSDSNSSNDPSYGVGADVNLNENFVINVEYTNYLDKDDIKISGFSIGVVRMF